MQYVCVDRIPEYAAPKLAAYKLCILFYKILRIISRFLNVSVTTKNTDELLHFIETIG